MSYIESWLCCNVTVHKGRSLGGQSCIRDYFKIAKIYLSLAKIKIWEGEALLIDNLEIQKRDAFFVIYLLSPEFSCIFNFSLFWKIIIKSVWVLIELGYILSLGTNGYSTTKGQVNFRIIRTNFRLWTKFRYLPLIQSTYLYQIKIENMKKDLRMQRAGHIVLQYNQQSLHHRK